MERSQNVTRNFVRGVRSSTAIWRIAGLRADVDTDGRLEVRGRGLLLGSGDRIGQNANQSVFATLICEAAAPFVERSTATMVFRSNRTAIFASTTISIRCRQTAPAPCC